MSLYHDVFAVAAREMDKHDLQWFGAWTMLLVVQGKELLGGKAWTRKNISVEMLAT